MSNRESQIILENRPSLAARAVALGIGVASLVACGESVNGQSIDVDNATYISIAPEGEIIISDSANLRDEPRTDSEDTSGLNVTLLGQAPEILRVDPEYVYRNPNDPNGKWIGIKTDTLLAAATSQVTRDEIAELAADDLDGIIWVNDNDQNVTPLSELTE